MKKINPASVTGGMPTNTGDLRTVFNQEIWDVIEAMFSQHSTDVEGVIVSGCVISGGGPYDISAGIVYLNGEFMRLPATTGHSLPKYIAPDAPVNDNRTFSDGTNKTAFITKSAGIYGSAPGSGQYIAITSVTDPDDRRLIPVKGSGLSLIYKEIEIGDWNMFFTGGGSGALNKNVTHGVADFKKIRTISIIIRNDADDTYYDIHYVSSADGFDGGGVNIINSTTINLSHPAGSRFDAASHSTTGYNRGWVTVGYKP